jgi:hypothetical protein
LDTKSALADPSSSFELVPSSDYRNFNRKDDSAITSKNWSEIQCAYLGLSQSCRLISPEFLSLFNAATHSCYVELAHVTEHMDTFVLPYVGVKAAELDLTLNVVVRVYPLFSSDTLLALLRDIPGLKLHPAKGSEIEPLIRMQASSAWAAYHKKCVRDVEVQVYDSAIASVDIKIKTEFEEPWIWMRIVCERTLQDYESEFSSWLERIGLDGPSGWKVSRRLRIVADKSGHTRIVRR